MGWFLSSKTSKSRNSKARGKKLTKKKSSFEGKGWNPGLTLANMWLISWTLLIGVGAAAWYFGESHLMDYVSEQHQDEQVAVELVDTPGWMDERLANQMRRELEVLVTADPFDRQSLEEAARTLARKPWVQQVQRIVRTGPGEVAVYAVYRRPTALLHWRDGYHLVDAEGVRLPIRYSAELAERTGLAIITGVESGPPEEGRLWQGDDVQAGLTMARLVAGMPWGESIASINMRNYGGRVNNAEPHIVLPTRYGGEVRWGRAIGEERFYEPHYEVKLSYIERLYNNHPRLWKSDLAINVYRDAPTVDGLNQGNSSGNVRYTLHE